MDIKKLLIEQASGRPAIIFKDKEISFSELRDKSFRLANGLLDAGIKKSSKVAVFLPNIPQAVFSYLGAALQERISGYLIHSGTTMIDGVYNYNFNKPILFWLGTSVLSLILASTLWRVKTAE